MLTLYQKLAILLVFSVIGGEIIIFYLKRALISPRVNFSVEFSGMIERILLFVVIISGGTYILLIPVIMIGRVLVFMSEGNFKKFSEIIKREEPAVEFQKIRVKSELGLTIIASPVIGILAGLIAKTL